MLKIVTQLHGVPCTILKVVSGRMGEEDANLRQTLANSYEILSKFLLERFN